MILSPTGRSCVGIVLAAATIVLGSLQAASAGASPRTGTGADPAIVLNQPAPPTIYEDGLTQLSGDLTDGAADQLIVLNKLVGSSWVRIGSTRTDSTGAFGYDYTPADPGTISVRATHSDDGGTVTSGTQTLHVLDRRVYLFSHPSYNTFTDIVMIGSTKPALRSQHVYLQHLVNGVWVSGANGFTNADGQYAIHMRNDVPGPWVVRAYWPGANPQGGTEEFSGVHHYTVNAILDPVVSAVTTKQLGGSYHAGCPVGPALLRNLAVTFKTFGDTVGRGTLVVRSTIVDRVISVWRQALERGYPIRKIFPTAHYGGSDISSMYHDNTSAFNCRHVTGDPSQLSPHAYGIALDINTVENPYMDIHGTWWPKTIGQKFRNRSHAYPGMLYDDSLVTTALKSRGFRWGGDWSHPDYQHFDTWSNGPHSQPAAKSAGPLTARSMPAGSALGAGWRTYADPGGADDGWTGNGTFVHARSGRDASVGVQPLGCQTRPRESLPTPGFALQGSYRSRVGAPAQAIVMQFGTPEAAARYFAGLESMLTGCTTADGPAGIVVRTDTATPTSFTGLRTYAGHETWREHDVRVGARVTVILARGRR